MDDLELTDAEQRVIDAISEVMEAIRDLYGGTPHNWDNEVVPAVHVLQQFSQQHWAHRINAGAWGDWTKEDCFDVCSRCDKRKLVLGLLAA